MNIMQILIVGFNQAVRVMIAEAVIALDYKVIQVSSGQEALNHVRQYEVDLMLMEVEMSGLNGFEVVKTIRDLKSDDWFPVILFATQVDDIAYGHCVKSGADLLLEKPVNVARLKLHVSALERPYQLRKKLQAAQVGLLKLNDTLKFLSMFDQLTGLANRRHFDDTLRREFKLAQRDKMPMSLLRCDIDLFKHYNEKYGQKTGDECLCAIASAISSVVQRPTDLLCRYGGDEFALILPKTNMMGAEDIAEKIRAAVQKRKIAYVDSPYATQITLSIGVVSFSQQFQYVHELTNALDEVLRFAQKNRHVRGEYHS